MYYCFLNVYKASGSSFASDSRNLKTGPSDVFVLSLTRVNSTNVLDEGLKIGEIGRRMNSKVKSVK
jgi:hypothetical protein